MAPPIRRFWRVAAVAPLLALSVGCARRTAVPRDAAVSAGRLMTPQEFQALPYNAPDQRLTYGEDSSQYCARRGQAAALDLPVRRRTSHAFGRAGVPVGRAGRGQARDPPPHSKLAQAT
jgi:hypothetical protein